MGRQNIQAKKVWQFEVKFPFSRSVPFQKEKVYTTRLADIFKGDIFILLFFLCTKISFFYSKITSMI